MLLEPGKLYKINEYFWLLFPTQETAAAPAALAAAAARRRVARAAAAAIAARPGARSALGWASYWSKELNCTVSFLNEGDIIMVVEVAGTQVKVISQEGKSGWINFPAAEKWTKDTIIEISDEP